MEDVQLRNSLSNDTVFNIISKKFISLPNNKVKINNRYLQQVNMYFALNGIANYLKDLAINLNTNFLIHLREYNRQRQL